MVKIKQRHHGGGYSVLTVIEKDNEVSPTLFSNLWDKEGQYLDTKIDCNKEHSETHDIYEECEVLAAADDESHLDSVFDTEDSVIDTKSNGDTSESLGEDAKEMDMAQPPTSYHIDIDLMSGVKWA